MNKLFLFAFFSFTAFAGTWQENKYTLGDDSRSYRFYVPFTINNESRPLLVALHGCVQSAKDFVGLARLEKLADEKRVYLLVPMQTRLANPNGCWNWFMEKNEQRDQGEAGIIMGMVKWAQNIFKIDAKRIYVMGPSAGGGMTSIMLANYPDVFAAGMVGSGTMHMAATGMVSGVTAATFGSKNDPSEMAVLGWEKLKQRNISFPKALPVLVFHGESDHNCNPKNALQVQQQFITWNDLLDDGVENQSVKSDAVSTEELQVPNGYAYTVKSFANDSGKILVKSVLVHKMGHGWSGGDDHFSFNFEKGPDETQIMWDFVSQFHK